MGGSSVEPLILLGVGLTEAAAKGIATLISKHRTGTLTAEDYMAQAESLVNAPSDPAPAAPAKVVPISAPGGENLAAVPGLQSQSAEQSSPAAPPGPAPATAPASDPGPAGSEAHPQTPAPGSTPAVSGQN